ncbi:MAG: F0F1 ATP synthase subunit A [Candidatus Cloacimonetes bacterium]|nr:F0F1 ATP synthase subunit A [Candidatus Cloacimonadota bacterium]
MKKKKLTIMQIMIIVGIIEIVLVIISGNFHKKLEIGFDDGKFVFRHVNVHRDLQNRITEEFQIDEFVKEASVIKSYEIEDYQKFGLFLAAHDHPVLEKIWDKLKPDIQNILISSSTEINEHKIKSILNDVMNIMRGDILYNNEFLSIILQSKSINSLGEDSELSDIITSFENSEANAEQKMSEREILRLNRILIEAIIPENIMDRQEHIPQIYGSYKLYALFGKLFGEANAIKSFGLLRILLIVDLVLLFFAFMIKRYLFDRPSKPQLIFEMIYTVFEDFVRDTLGKERLNYTPYIVTLFIFIWLCNMIGLIPIPGFMEPTRNLNVPLGLGLLAVVLVHITAIKVKGVWGHFQKFVNPVKHPLFLLDIIGEVSKVVSISFRLFGNIIGGAIIIVVVSSLVNFVVLPVGLSFFFGIFVGSIQAFVFTMLALTYIGVEIAEE